jgi:hypothetical protein
MTPRVKALLMLLTSTWLAACGDEQEYAGVDFEVLSAPPIDVKVQSDSIEIPAGVAVQVFAKVASSGPPFNSSDRVTFVGRKSSVVDVFLTARERQVFLVGRNPGSTCLEVRINREEVDCIPVDVSSQE